MVLHQKEARNKNQNLIAFRIPVELSVTLRKLGVNPKTVCIRALYEVAGKNELMGERGLKRASFQGKLVGLGRFELPSRAPEARSLDQASPQPQGGAYVLISLLVK